MLRSVELEPLSPQGFEFPAIAFAQLLSSLF